MKMALKFLTFFVILISSGNWDSFSLRKGVKGEVEECFIASDQGQEAEEENYSFPEFEKVTEFLRPVIDRVENEKCQKQLETLIKSLRNSSLWAVQMFDASAKTVNGLLASDAYELGNYDACVEINLKRAQDDNILGKYCLVKLSTKNLNISHSRDEPVHEAQLWENLMVPIFKYGFVNNLCRCAVCVPNECSPRDVENIFQFLFNNTSKKLKKELVISVPENACSTANADEFIGVIYVKKITPLIFLWVAIITIFDLLGWFPKSESVWIKILVNFSAYKNFKILTFSDYRESVRVVNSLKVYAVIFLVMIRRISFFLAGPIMNRKDLDRVFEESSRETFFFISNNIIADTFLVLDGFIHFYRVYNCYLKKPEMNIWSVYVFHFLNACPLYITAIFFYGYIFETVGTGPMWQERTGKFVKNCKESWVVNLMNLNNFLKVNGACVFESWRFAVAAQCFVIVPVLAKITQKASTPGKIAFKLLMAPVFALPLLKFYFSPDSSLSFANERGDVYWHQKLDTDTLSRASAYLLGVFSSLIHIRSKKNKLTFLKAYEKTSLRPALAVLFLGLCAQVNLKRMSPLQKAYASSFRQVVWCLFISYVLLGVSDRKLRIAPLLGGKYLVPLGRLSFSYLLVLDLIQIYSIGIMRTLDYFSLPRMVWITSADLLATSAVAFVFYMIVHRPISNILHEKFFGVPFYNQPKIKNS